MIAMRCLQAAFLIAPLLAAPAFSAAADPTPSPPFIDHTQWVTYGNLPTLRVYPTSAGRALAGQLGKTPAQTSEAWSEVLAFAPNADTPGMRAQFVCHWRLAEFAEPGKASWNLEPWRTVVDDNTMLVSGCNPGGADSSS